MGERRSDHLIVPPMEIRSQYQNRTAAPQNWVNIRQEPQVSVADRA